MSNKNCGPDIVKYFVVEPSSGTITGSTGDFYVCSGTTFLKTISGCIDSVDLNNNLFYNNGDVYFNGVISACTGIHTSNLYGCSPITIHDLAIFERGIDVVTGDTILLTASATTFTLTNVPNLNNTATQILTRNTTTGLVEYRDVNTITPDTNTFVTGTTFNSNQAVLTRNDGFDVLKLSGGSNVTLSNPSTNQIKIDVSIPPDTNTFVTGGTYNPSTDTITLTRNDSVQIDITGVTDTFTTGGTYDNGTKLITFVKNDGTNYSVNLSTIDTNDTFTTGFTYDNVNTFTINRNDGVDLSTTITTLSGVTYYGNGIGLTNIPLSGVTNLQTELDSKTNLTLFNTHTGDTNNPHQTSFSNLTSTAHTHTLSEITDFSSYSGSVQTQLDSKLNITDFNTYSGNVQTQIDSKLDITTFNTYTGNTQSLLDTKISGATNLSSEGIFAQKNGLDLEFKGITSTGGTVNISSNSSSVNLEVTFPTDQDKFVSGGTYNGGTKEINFVGNSVDTTFDVDLTSLVSSVSANTYVIDGVYNDSTDTLSLLRNDGNFVNITGITDTFTTGATYDNGTATATFTRNDGNTYTLDLSTIDVNDTFVTGFTYNNANTFTISRNDGVDLNSSFNTVTGLTVNGTLDATTILSGGTNLTTIIESLDTNTFVSGGTYNTGTQEINFVGNSPETTFDVDLSSIISTDTYVTGFTFNPSTYDLTIKQNEGQPDLVSNLAVLASDVYVVSGVYNPATGIVTYTNSSGGTFQVSGFTTGMTDSYTTDAYLSGTEIRFDNNIQGVNFYNVDLLPVLSGKTDLTLFNSHTADTNNPHQTSFNNLTSTAHTHTISDVINLQTELDSKLDITTFNTYTANTQTILDGKIDSANNVGGANEFFKDKSGTTLNFRTLSGGSNTTVSTIGDVVKIDTVDLFTTGATYNNGTALATFTKNDGTTYTLDLSSIDVNDTYVTGGTLTQPTNNTNSGLINLLYSQDVSPATYTLPYTDTFITGFTYNNNNTFTIVENNGNSFSSTFNEVSGLTVNGTLDVIGNLNVTGTTFYTNITGTSIGVDYIDFNNALAPLPTDLEGRIYWDDDNGSLSLGMHGGQVVQQIGLEHYYYIKNQSGATIDNGRVVRAAGTLGSSGRILGEYMIADGTIPAKFTLGIATENIVNGDDGYVTEFGLVRGIDATGSLYGESWSGGTILYVSPTIPGGLTSIEPTAPDLKIQMAIVIDASANGSIFVRPDRYPHIYDLQQVNYSAGTENNLDILQWNESNLTWDKTNTPSFSGLTVYNNINHFGNYILDGDISQTGNYNVTGNTTQIGDTTTKGTVDIIGSGTGCTLSVTGKTCLDGNLEITGDVNVIGNLTYDGNLIITGATTITSGATITSGLTTDTLNISSTPTENNDLIQILGRNSSTGDVEYRDVKTIGNNITTVTGSTYSATTTDDVIGIDSSTNTVTLYLPDSVSSGRLRYDIKDIGVNSFVNPITVQAAGSDTIITTSVVSSFELSADGGAVILVNTGTGQWWQM